MRKTQPLDERFWSKVAKVHEEDPDACWEWTGARDKQRRGYISVGGRAGGMRFAHRIAWELTNGAIPDGVEVCHRCDNPPCCRPSHLFLGTHKENMTDRDQKGRSAHQSTPEQWHEAMKGTQAGSLHSQHKLTEEQVLEICRRYEAGTTSTYKLAEEFGVSPANISLIVNARAWKHITAGDVHHQDIDGRTTRSAEEVVAAVQLVADGHPLREASRLSGISLGALRHYVAGTERQADVPSELRQAAQDSVRGPGRPFRSESVRLWSKTDQSAGDDGCWLWTGAVDRQGFGYIQDDAGKTMKVHRLAYRLSQGDLPDGCVVERTCKQKLCCNPKHLYVTSVSEARQRGRKLTEDDVREIKRLLQSGLSARDIGPRFGVTDTEVHNIKSGKHWKHVV